MVSALAFNMNPDAVTWVTYQTVAQRRGQNVETARQNMASLVELGWLVEDAGHIPGKRGRVLRGVIPAAVEIRLHDGGGDEHAQESQDATPGISRVQPQDSQVHPWNSQGPPLENPRTNKTSNKTSTNKTIKKTTEDTAPAVSAAAAGGKGVSSDGLTTLSPSSSSAADISDAELIGISGEEVRALAKPLGRDGLDVISRWKALNPAKLHEYQKRMSAASPPTVHVHQEPERVQESHQEPETDWDRVRATATYGEPREPVSPSRWWRHRASSTVGTNPEQYDAYEGMRDGQSIEEHEAEARHRTARRSA
jgi:hypothetical protein